MPGRTSGPKEICIGLLLARLCMLQSQLLDVQLFVRLIHFALMALAQPQLGARENNCGTPSLQSKTPPHHIAKSPKRACDLICIVRPRGRPRAAGLVTPQEGQSFQGGQGSQPN